MREGISALLALEDEMELVAGCETYDELLRAVDEHEPDVVITDIRMPPTQTDEGIRAGEEAVEMAATLRPDLVLMDVQMPGIDGFEATRRITAVEHPPRVLVLSTHESGNYEEPALDAGAIGFVPKSQFGMDTLDDVWDQLHAGD